MYKQEWQKWLVDEGKIAINAPIYFWTPKLYDLSIDTYKSSKEETLNIVLEALGWQGKPSFKNIFTE